MLVTRENDRKNRSKARKTIVVKNIALSSVPSADTGMLTGKTIAEINAEARKIDPLLSYGQYVSAVNMGLISWIKQRRGHE
jgi:hypothetical protein